MRQQADLKEASLPIMDERHAWLLPLAEICLEGWS
jgi:hypothetical protein